MVEPVLSHIKENQGLRRFRRRGLVKVRLEFMLHLIAYNLSRAVALARASGLFCARALAAATRRLLASLRALTRLWPVPAALPTHTPGAPMFDNGLHGRGATEHRD
jgi:hypothetical protein